jgi:hypothetical protein
MAIRSGIAFLLVGVGAVFACTNAWSGADPALDQINIQRSKEKLPPMPNDLAKSLALLMKECINDDVQSSCQMLQNAQANINRAQAMQQQQQLQMQQLQLQQMQRSQQIQEQFSRPVIGGMYQSGCEAMGLHGECTTRAKLEKDIERTTPHY